MSPGFNVHSPYNSGTPINLDLEHLQDRGHFRKPSDSKGGNRHGGQNSSRITPRSRKKKKQSKKKKGFIDQDDIKTLVVDKDAIETKIEMESEDEMEAAMDRALEVHVPTRKKTFHEKLIKQASLRDPEYYDQIYDLRQMRLQLKREGPLAGPGIAHH